MKEYWLDANVIVRFLVQDDLRQSAAATALLQQAERGEIALYVDSLVVAETVYVLTGRYELTREDVCGALLEFLQNPGIRATESDVLMEALRRFGGTKVDFSDAWLAARSVQTQVPVASFDRDFNKLKDVRRLEPS